MSQQRLADVLGVHRNSILKWEMGRAPIPHMAELLIGYFLLEWEDTENNERRRKRREQLTEEYRKAHPRVARTIPPPARR